MYPIRYTSFPPKKEFTVNELEIKFFESLSSRLTDQENSKIQLLRMSDGTLSVEYSRYPVGKVKLQGRKCSMHVIKSPYKSECFEVNIEMFNEKIKNWVDYIRKHLK